MSTSTDSVEGGTVASTPKPATIYDVALAAGVSHQTVSRFLRGFEGIRPETRERVVRALDELGYRPNLTARSLKSGRSHRIGALTHEISHVGPSRVAQGASTAAREAGYVLDLVSLDVHDAREIEESLELLTQQDLAGVLALASTDEMVRAFETTEFRVPAYIAAEADDALTGHPSELTGVGLPGLIAHLAELGHRTVVHIAGPSTWAAARNRINAYEAAAERHGLRSLGVLPGDWSARSGYEAIAALAELPAATAYVAANDQMALGAMLALKERGRRIPDDVSVVGLDDIPEAAYFDPPLTTLRNDFESQGRASVAELLARIEGTPVRAVQRPPSQLIVRRSSGPPPAEGGRPRDIRS
ncbi:LacI family DNA-binding transcriptional regulator [Agromyces subbeticus]|uniref:LacI family DNA-binding transcriptional regulator n=1 Tax=Agromyces subbeticus TaxID=293890 RepID=UPI0003B740B9|nr:LacI family DNA-binding transcriptional regulator [Agromyces subbeticus]